MHKIIQALTLSFALSMFTYAQNTDSLALVQAKATCSQKLKEMQKSYELGHIDIIPDGLKPCMNGGFTKVEKIQGYRLIILSYLFLDEPAMARNAMNELLNFEPDYKPNASLDPIDYIKLYNSFRIIPVVSFGLGLGLNNTSVNQVNNFTTGSDPQAITQFVNGTNLLFGAAADVLLYKKIYISTEGYYYTRSYQSNRKVLSNSILAVVEVLNSLQFPVSLKWVVGNRKIRGYLRAGVAPDYLLSSNATMVRENTLTNQNDFAGPSFSLLAQRNAINFSLLAGAGVTYKLGYGYVFLDARYLKGFSNYTKTAARYQNFNTQITNYGYLSDDFGLDNLQATVGYMHNIFKVKSKKIKFD